MCLDRSNQNFAELFALSAKQATELDAALKRIAELETQLVLAHEFDAWNEEVPQRLVPEWRARHQKKAAGL